ncbi:MAG: hypothetical protein CMF76_00575, partial [Maricaulis sp.]|nr:hypothetical protein [Maricaulis sp.]
GGEGVEHLLSPTGERTEARFAQRIQQAGGLLKATKGEARAATPRKTKNRPAAGTRRIAALWL